MAKPNIIASIDFDPTHDGYSFDSQNIDQPGSDSFEVDFSKWDSTHPPCLEDDDDGDGFDDETCG